MISVWVLLMCLHFLRTPLYSVATRCSRTILYFPCSNAEINQFSIEPWSSCWKVVVRNQDMGSRCAYCCWGITTLNPSKYIALESICMLTNLCTNTYLYIFISVSAYLCLFIHYMQFFLNEYILAPPTLV